MPARPRREEYTVGWICALPIELAAAQEMLDEEHEDLESDHGDNDENLYTLGSIGGHNVVIVCLPVGRIGNNPAAAVATQMRATFKGIRFGLMVGIGGGVPSAETDIRLGDVVVSKPQGTFGGVVQYDAGKTTPSGFERTGSLNAPPQILLNAVARVLAKKHRGISKLSEYVSMISRLPDFQRKKAGPDVLFKAVYDHEGGQTCDKCSTDRQEARPPRASEEEVVVHYGTIASGNQVMRDARTRDRLSRELDGILCFEMEAAGLMNSFPCLVIRGICDYADSHKNKAWQPYAAGTAAAYAKEVLSVITPSKVEAEKKIGEVLYDIRQVAQENRNIAQKQLEMQEDEVKQRLSDKQKECLQLFRLTESTNVTYEWYKDRVEDRVEGTCKWFLDHEYFQEWLKQESGPLLVSADPGCGKSVLAKYLIDHALPRSATICYFFFKDQDQNTVRQALCALLHQLFSQKPSLIKHAMKQFEEDKPGLTNSTRSLWAVLGDAVHDPQAGSVIIVLDALDECAESESENLMRNVESQLCSNQSGHGKLKYLLTSRPYEQVVSKFRRLLDDFPRIHIPGEEESEIISQEVNHVIQNRVERLAKEKELSSKVKDHLADRLLKLTHRTYLWVYLVFEYLKEGFKKTPKGVESAIETLPRNVNQAYERILNRSKEHSMVRKALAIILAAGRPLTLSEMNVAVNMDDSSKDIHDIDLEEEQDFKSRLRSWCGLFVSIHHGKIYFLHQTAREFLLANQLPSTTISTELGWHHSITINQAHNVLAELCVRYLNFFDSDASLLVDSTPEASHHVNIHTLLDYSATFWGLHFREACISNDDAALARYALKISDPDLKAYSVWSQIYWESEIFGNPRYSTVLVVASYFGHDAVAKLVLDKGADLESKDDKYGRTPLSWAAEHGREAVVKLLLDKGAELESRDDNYGRTPLSWAAENGHEAVVRLLLDKGTDLESKDNMYNWTPLSWAAKNGHEAVVRLLLDKGADLELTSKEYDEEQLLVAARKGHEAVVKRLVDKGADLESKDKKRYGQTPLSWASENGHGAVVMLLLDMGADLESKEDKYGRTPLSWAADNGHETVVKLLLDKGADLESKDREYSRTPLSWASENGHGAVVRLLLDKAADLDSKDREYSRTPLSWSAEKGREAVVKLLLDKGADLESKDDKYGRTPLSWAADNGRETVVKLLLDKGADLESKDDKYGRTPLSWAADNGRETVVKLLLDKGADLESKDDKYGRTPLSWAADNGRETVVKLLLDKGADLESKDDKYGRTPLSWAADNGRETVVKLLLDKGADLESKDDKYGRTPLSWAADNGRETVVKLLLDKGADLESKDDKYGRTPLSWAAENGREAVVKLLLDKCADLESKDDKYGRTPLSWAADSEAVVKLLLDKGADLESKDYEYGRTPLSWAAENGHEAVVRLLLDKGADLESKDNVYSWTPLSWAVGYRHEAVVKLLLDKGTNLELTSKKYDEEQLLVAARKGHEAVVKRLVDKGADLESKDKKRYGQTPLSWASENGHGAVVRLLLDMGADLESKEDKYGRTPLSWAADNGHETVVKLLVDKGADLESKDREYSRTPLSWASEKGREAVVKLLLDKGADLESKDREYSHTPQSWAAENGCEAVVKLLSAHK
ncbi:Ankyrin repeat domain-containing protein 50-like protein 1 [Paraphaeosphaeria sporulosa]